MSHHIARRVGFLQWMVCGNPKDPPTRDLVVGPFLTRRMAEGCAADFDELDQFEARYHAASPSERLAMLEGTP